MDFNQINIDTSINLAAAGFPPGSIAVEYDVIAIPAQRDSRAGPVLATFLHSRVRQRKPVNLRWIVVRVYAGKNYLIGIDVPIAVGGNLVTAIVVEVFR